MRVRPLSARRAIRLIHQKIDWRSLVFTDTVTTKKIKMYMSVTMSMSEALTLLALPWPATPEQIRHQYRQQVKRVHPDVSEHAGHQGFLRLQAAYQLLLQLASSPLPAQADSPQPKTPVSPQAPSSRTPHLTEVRVSLSAKQALSGGKHPLNLTWQVNCHRCKNQTLQKATCSQCQQTGQKAVTHTLTIVLPKGLTHGSQMRLVKQGIPQQNGDPSDLLITFDVDTPPAEPLTMQLTLTVWQALLGGEVPVITPKGKVNWTIPEGLQPGAVICFSGMDLSGDWRVPVTIEMPKTVSSKLKKQLADCAKQADHKPTQR
jgi:DnaJ-class molecular chaperone